MANDRDRFVARSTYQLVPSPVAPVKPTPLAVQGPPGPEGPPGPAGHDGSGGGGSSALATMAALRALAVPATSPVTTQTTGYHAQGDIDGDFYWDSSSTLVDDGGLTARPATVPSGSPGRWRRRYQKGRIDPKWFGAIGDGTSHPLSEFFATLADAQVTYPHATSLTDEMDWCAWQAAANAAKAVVVVGASTAHGGELSPSKGRYLFNQPLDIKATLGLGLRGQGLGVGAASANAGAVTLVYTGADSRRFIDARSSVGVLIENVAILYSSVSYHGRLVDFDHYNGGDSQSFTLRNCTLSGDVSIPAGTGARCLLHLGNSITGVVDSCLFGVAEQAIRFRENDGSYSNAHIIDKCTFVYHKYSLVNAGEACKITNPTFEGSAGVLQAAYFDDYTDVVVRPACTFTFDAAGQTITRSSGSWIADGWVVGMVPTAFELIGGLNTRTFAHPVSALSATVMTLSAGAGIVNEVRTHDCKIFSNSIVTDAPSPTSDATLGVVLTITSSTITRDNGSWIDDLVYIGTSLNLNGSASNDGAVGPVTGISADGKTISVAADSLVFAGNTVTRSDGRNFADDGWVNGMLLTVGNTASNNGTYGAVTVAGSVLTVAGASFAGETSSTADLYSLFESRFQARTLASAGQVLVAEAMTAGRCFQTFSGGPVEFSGVWAGDQFVPMTWLQFGGGNCVELAGVNHFIGGLRVAEFRQACTGFGVSQGTHAVTTQEPFKFANANKIKIDAGSLSCDAADIFVAATPPTNITMVPGTGAGTVQSAVHDEILKSWKVKVTKPAELARDTPAVDFTSLAILIAQGGGPSIGFGSEGNVAIIQANGRIEMQWYGGHVNLCTQALGSVGIGYPYHDSGFDPTSRLHVRGAIATAIDTFAANSTVDADIDASLTDCTAGVVTHTLPSAVSCKGREYTFKKIDASANAVHVATVGGQTFDGAASPYVLSAKGNAVTIKSDGANWIVKSSMAASSGGSPPAAPSVVAGTASGTASVISVAGNQECGVVTFTAGVTPDAADAPIFTLTLASAYATKAVAVFQLGNANAAVQADQFNIDNSLYVQTTAGTVELRARGGSQGFIGGSVYEFHYRISGY